MKKNDLQKVIKISSQIDNLNSVLMGIIPHGGVTIGELCDYFGRIKGCEVKDIKLGEDIVTMIKNKIDEHKKSLEKELVALGVTID